jgi:hypothetical protein
MATDVAALADTVKALSAADQLRLAAGLIERGEYDTAEAVIRLASDALALRRLFPNPAKRSK